MASRSVKCFVSASCFLTACSSPAPAFCCLTLEDCQQFDINEVRECAGAQECLGNQCVPASDAPVADGPGPDAPNPCEEAGGQIVFQTDRDGDFEIARIGADGTGFELLTLNSWNDQYPVWSHDARFIAWVSTPTGATEVDVMKSDGTDPHLVSPTSVEPAWSPVADRLVLQNLSQIYAVDADGTDLVDLSQDPSVGDSNPAWSPNGTRVVFGRDNQIFTMNADGSDQSLLTSPGGSPSWSPTGTYIAFIDSTQGLMRTGATGGGGVTVIFPGQISSLDWSPDGSNLVVCERASISASDLYLVSAEGKGGVPLTTTGKDCHGRWSPDGTRIAFNSLRDGNWEIYVANADGTSPVNLTMAAGSDLGPMWAPCR